MSESYQTDYLQHHLRTILVRNTEVVCVNQSRQNGKKQELK